MLDSNTFLTLCLCLITSLFFFLFLLYSSHSHSHSRSHPPNKTPCPQSYPIIGNLIGFLRNRHRFHDWVSDMLSQTPSLTLQVNGFLTTRGICTANPRNVDHLLAANFPNYVKGSRYRDNLRDFLGDGIFNADGNLWTAQRKISSHEFNTKSLKHFVSYTVQSQLSHRLIPFLSAACDDKSLVDLQHALRRFGFENICQVAFGVDPVSTNNLNNSSFVEAFDHAVEISSSRFMSPLPLIWKIKRFFNVGTEKRFRQAMKIIDEYAMEIIRNREQDQQSNSNEQDHDYQNQEKSRKNQDLLSRFMESSSKLEFEGHEQRRKFLRDIVISFILAGKDSTSTALTWFFWLIAGNPQCERLIYSELSSATPANQSGIFSYDELKGFNYLHAALSESMRLFPPVPINSRLTVDDDVLPDGTHVRKGWFADYSAYAMGRMEELWGPDCREFKPERWLDEVATFRPSDQFRFPVFHCGPRICLGKEMAYVQMKAVAAAVMHEFEIVAVDGGGCAERMMEPPYTISLLLKMKGGFLVRLKRRQKSTNMV